MGTKRRVRASQTRIDIRLIRVLMKAQRPMTAAELTRATEMNDTTVYRQIKALEKASIVARAGKLNKKTRGGSPATLWVWRQG